jgi:recombination protein RecA
LAQASKSTGIKRVVPVEGTNKEVKSGIDTLVGNLEKKFGAGIISRVDKKTNLSIPVIPTGIPQVDLEVLQAGGVPRGKIIEIFGPEAGGKTTMTLQIIAEAMAVDNRRAGFIDAEHALSPKRAQQLGVDLSRFLISQPDCGEQGLEIAEDMVRSGLFSVVAIDSVSALVPRAELDGEMGDSHVGLQARLMSQGLRKLTAITSQADTLIIFINQIREKIGVTFGSPETTSGGRALKFYASVRLDIRRTEQIKDGDKIIGARTKVKGAKNRVGSPLQEAVVDLLYTSGFDKVGSWVDMAIREGVVVQSGAWFSYKGERLGQGRKNVIALIRDNVDIFASIKEDVRAALKKEPTAQSAVVADEEPIEP